MRHLRPADYRRMPWKNGGGMTTEIAAEPHPDRKPDRPFLWRVSIAEVAADGPFSLFPGYDRHIMLIEGEGMLLDAGGHGTIELAPRLRPKMFSGDWAVEGRLIGGPVRDFNVIFDRSLVMAQVEVLTIADASFELAAGKGETLLLHLLESAARLAAGAGAPAELTPSSTLILETSDTLSIEPSEAGATLVLVRLSRR